MRGVYRLGNHQRSVARRRERERLGASGLVNSRISLLTTSPGFDVPSNGFPTAWNGFRYFSILSEEARSVVAGAAGSIAVDEAAGWHAAAVAAEQRFAVCSELALVSAWLSVAAESQVASEPQVAFVCVAVPESRVPADERVQSGHCFDHAGRTESATVRSSLSAASLSDSCR